MEFLDNKIMGTKSRICYKYGYESIRRKVCWDSKEAQEIGALSE